jgi:hypothetical protein
MSSKKRRRFNPLEEGLAPREAHAQAEGAIEAISQASGTSPREASPVERIERLKPSQMMPDRFQPRRLLPGEIRRRFFSGEIDCYQAARAWLKLAQADGAWHERVAELLDMGDSFEDHGQIKPITGVWHEGPEGGFTFQIETGERRFWAACLQAVKEGFEQEPLLRVEVVPQATRERQVLENRHAQSPSAVGQACEIAALILEAAGEAPDPEVEDAFEYFRLALERRVPRGSWPKMEPLMQLSTRRMQQLLSVLRLPSPLLELADRHRVPERVLREVLSLPEGRWEAALRAAVQEDMTSEQVAAMGAAGKGRQSRGRAEDARPSSERVAFLGMRRFVRALLNAEPEDQGWILDGVADELVVRGLAEDLMPMLEALAERVGARLARRG